MYERMADLWPRMRRAHGPDSKPEQLACDVSSFVQINTCPVCDDDACFETVHSEVSCTRCGTRIDIQLDWGAEYRWFSTDNGGTADPSRCGFPVNPLMPESSLGTIISDKQYNPLMTRLRRTHARNIVPSREQTLWKILETLKLRALNAGISSSVLEEAKELYAQVTATEVCRGEVRRESMMAACIWEALKRHGSPRMPRDIAEIFHIPVQWVTRGVKQFQTLLSFRTSAGSTDTYATRKSKPVHGPGPGLDVPELESEEVLLARAFQRCALWQKATSHTTDYNDFIRPFLTNLSIPQLESLVHQVCSRADEMGIVPENTPPSLVASVIAFCVHVTGRTLPNEEISRVCSISVVTIQKCVKRLQPWKEKLLAE